MRPDVRDGGQDVNEKNTPPKKMRKTNREYILKIMFASVSQQRMAEWADEQSPYGKKDGIKETVSTLAWSSPEGDGYSPSTKNVIFVDCSSDMGDAYDADTFKDTIINPRIFYAIERIKMACYRKSKKNSECGTIHCIILAYHPCEKHMFAMSNLFGHSLPEQEVYSSYISFINSKVEYKYSLRWVEEEYGWSFDVQYCGVFEGYDFVVVDKSEDKKKAHMLKLANELDNVSKRAGLSDAKDEKGRYLVPDRIGLIQAGNVYNLRKEEGPFPAIDWGDDKYGTEYVDLNRHKLSDNQFYDSDAHDRNYNYVVPTINYRGEQLTSIELSRRANGEFSSEELRTQANKLEKAYNDKQSKRQTQIDNIDKKIKQLEAQQSDPNSKEYQEWQEIEQLDKDTAEKYKKENNGYSGAYHHHSQDTIDYHGAFLTKSELEQKKKNILNTMAEERKQYESLRDSAEMKDKLAQLQDDTFTSLFLAFMSFIFPPVVLLDVCFEVYKWIRDGDNLKDHAMSLGFDFIGLVPMFGGGAKLVRQLKIAKNLALAEKQIGKMAITGEKAIASMEKATAAGIDASRNMAKAAEAGQKITTLMNDAQKVVTKAQARIASNKDKIFQNTDRLRQCANNASKIKRNEGYIEAYQKALPTLQGKNKATLAKKIKDLQAENAALEAANAGTKGLAAETRALLEQNRALSDAVVNVVTQQGDLGKNLAALERIFNGEKAKLAQSLVDFGKASKQMDSALSPIAKLEAFHKEIVELREGSALVTMLNASYNFKSFIPSILKPSEWMQFAHGGSKGELLVDTLHAMDMIGNTGTWINIGLAGFTYYDSVEKMDAINQHLQENLPPEVQQQINESVEKEIAAQTAEMLEERRDEADREAMEHLKEQYNLSDEEIDELIQLRKGPLISEDDNMMKVLTEDFMPIDDGPMTDEEIEDIKKDAESKVKDEQTLQDGLQNEIDRRKEAGAKDQKAIQNADKRYDEAWGQLYEDRAEVQNHLDMLDYSLGTDEYGGYRVTDPKEREQLEKERAKWQSEADNLSSPQPIPMGRYANDIKDYRNADSQREAANSAWQAKYGTTDLEKQKRESENRQRQAEILAEKADDALNTNHEDKEFIEQQIQSQKDKIALTQSKVDSLSSQEQEANNNADILAWQGAIGRKGGDDSNTSQTTNGINYYENLANNLHSQVEAANDQLTAEQNELDRLEEELFDAHKKDIIRKNRERDIRSMQ